MRIVIRTDGSRELGMGHVTRSVAVADELRDLGAEVVFYSRGDMMARYIADHSYVLRSPLSTLRQPAPDIVLNDMPPGGEVPNNWRARQLFLADLITGPETMPIRREVLRARDIRDHGGHYGVLVTAGWSDSWGLAEPMREETFAAEALFVPQIPDSMLGAAQRCSLAVTTAGVTAWELACIGTPMIVVAPTDQHYEDAQPLERAGAALVIKKPVIHGGLSWRVKELLEDRARLGRMGRAGRALVDGLGARRVAERIMEEAAR